ncbi:MAG: hypothetical protein U5K51_07100 [Flavobacteriaceae bacterium]|nr:hypothetical protein [Flavobacteriaceae bacterium]
MEVAILVGLIAGPVQADPVVVDILAADLKAGQVQVGIQEVLPVNNTQKLTDNYITN